MDWKSSLERATRSQSFLWKFAIGAILFGAAIGYTASRLQPSSNDNLAERVLARSGVTLEAEDPDRPKDFVGEPDISPAFATEIAKPGVNFTDVLWAVPRLGPHVSSKTCESIRGILAQRFSAKDADLAADYLSAWKLSDHDALDRLRMLADRSDAPRYADYAAGNIEMRRRDYRAAYAHFLRESRNPAARESRYQAVHALIKAKDFDTLKKLTRDPAFGVFLTRYLSLQIAIEREDWRGIFKGVPLAALDSYEWKILFVTAVAGLTWAYFLGHLGEVPRLFSTTSFWCLVAFAAGVASTIPTGYLVILEENILHFTANEDLVRTFAFYIGGVGAREELCKLLLFVPLIPFLVRRDDELEALLVASFVGLGFAIEENANYFMNSAATDATGRFLTANFFHVALTGVNGLALFRVFTRGAAGLNDLLVVLPLSIAAHGCYDALLDLPGIDGGSYFAMAIYVAFCSLYFGRFHQLRTNLRMTVGLTGAFVMGLSVLIATVTAYMMIELGPSAALSALAPELVGNAVLLFMFFREFDERLAA